MLRESRLVKTLLPAYNQRLRRRAEDAMRDLTEDLLGRCAERVDGFEERHERQRLAREVAHAQDDVIEAKGPRSVSPLVDPGLVTPGQRTISGSRMPPS